MKQGRPSWTAEGVASIRALETALHPPERRLFDDPIARRMLRGRFRLVIHSRPLALAACWVQQHRYAGMGNEVLARARCAQERIAIAALSGLRQVVVLGAGFDGSAWLPGLPDDMRVFEVDRPETQALKRARLASAGIAEPDRLVFIAADLREDRLAESLAGAGFHRDRPAMVVLLGLLMYLTRAAVESLLEQIGTTFASGSEILFNHFSRYMLDPERRPSGVARAARRLARQGEPFLFAADPSEMEDLVRRAGMRVIENLDGAELTRRYFGARGDRRTIEPGVNLARAVIDR